MGRGPAHLPSLTQLRRVWPGAAQQRTRVAGNQRAAYCVWQGPGEPRDVFLKVASGPSPEIKDFFVIIYA